MLDGVDRNAIRMLGVSRDRIVRMRARRVDVLMRVAMFRSRMRMMAVSDRRCIEPQILRKTLMGGAAQDHRRGRRGAQRDRHREQQNDQQVQSATHGESITPKCGVSSSLGLGL